MSILEEKINRLGNLYLKKKEQKKVPSLIFHFSSGYQTEPPPFQLFPFPYRLHTYFPSVTWPAQRYSPRFVIIAPEISTSGGPPPQQVSSQPKAGCIAICDWSEKGAHPDVQLRARRQYVGHLFLMRSRLGPLCVVLDRCNYRL